VLDRFSHFLQLTATKDTTAETTAAIFLNDWLCSFGVPATITTDGGTSFTGKAFTDVLQRYRIKHHVSAPHHPQGHGAVERANQTVEQIIRALLKDKATWHQLVKPAAFAINTAYSRVIGTTPFNVVHGFSPRPLIHAEMGSAPEPSEGDEPAEVASNLVTATQKMFQDVRRAEAAAFERARARFLRSNRQRTEYSVGDHVLVWYPRPNKLAESWRGPYQVVAKENEVVYVVQDLNTHEKQRVHVNRMHIFYPGDLKPDQLAAEAAKEGEYYIEAVHTTRSSMGRPGST